MISNAEILDSTYKTCDTLSAYIKLLVATLEEQGISEQARNSEMYKLMDKLTAASEGTFPGIVTLTLSYTLYKFLDHVIQTSTPT